MNNALTVSRRGFGLGAAAFGLLLVSGCSRGSSSEGGGLGSGSGKLTLAYNSDGPHKTWAEAVCHSVSNVLGITMEPLPVAQFSEMRSAITKHTLLRLPLRMVGRLPLAGELPQRHLPDRRQRQRLPVLLEDLRRPAR